MSVRLGSRAAAAKRVAHVADPDPDDSVPPTRREPLTIDDRRLLPRLRGLPRSIGEAEHARLLERVLASDAAPRAARWRRTR